MDSGYVGKALSADLSRFNEDAFPFLENDRCGCEYTGKMRVEYNAGRSAVVCLEQTATEKRKRK